MATAVNATGGRVWQPNSPAVKGKIKRLLKGLLDYSIVIIFFLLIVAFMVMIFGKIASLPVEVISSTNSSIQLSTTDFNQGSAGEKIVPWIPTALGLKEAQVSETLLPTITDGTKGTVTLTNGDIIPFTLHNSQDSTFTVTKE